MYSAFYFNQPTTYLTTCGNRQRNIPTMQLDRTKIFINIGSKKFYAKNINKLEQELQHFMTFMLESKYCRTLFFTAS